MSELDLLIKNGKVYTEAGFQDLDIAASGEKIAFLAVPGTIPQAEKTIDAKGKYVLPGLIDVHAHIRDPGFTHKEDFETGSRAAAAGGVTLLCAQCNLDPVPNTVETYRMEVEAGESKSLVDFNALASPLLYKEGWVPKLAAEGTAWFKIFQKVTAYPYSTPASDMNTAHLFEAFQEIAKTGKYCAIHPFDHYFFDEVEERRKLGPPMTPEDIHLYRGLEMVSAAYQLYYLAKKAGMKWYALHCNGSPDYMDLVRLAKAEGKIDVVADWNNVWLNIFHRSKIYDAKREEWVDYALPAPLPYDIEKLWAALNDGTIDFLGTDHAPHTREELTKGDPPKIQGALSALEWLGHLWLNEVNKGNITLEKLAEAHSVKAAKIFGFYPRKGAILTGSDADLIICDLEKEWTITSEKVYTKTQLNPHHGQKIKGKVTHTIVRGEVIMEEGKVIGKPGFGKFIPVY